MEIITGILLGLSTLIFIGPVFFYLLKSTIEHGYKAGIAVTIGIIVGDMIYVLIALKGLGKLLQDENTLKWLTLAGGLFLLSIGINYLFFSLKNHEIVTKINATSFWIFGLNGFLINFINPFVFGVWILFLSINQSKFDSETAVLTSLTCTLVIIFLTDCIKVFFAHKLRRFTNPKSLKIIYKVFGIIMIAFSLRLFFEFI